MDTRLLLLDTDKPQTHWGCMCPAEAPEEQAVGLVRNLALMCEVSTKSPASPVIGCHDESGLERFTDISASDLADRRVTKGTSVTRSLVTPLITQIVTIVHFVLSRMLVGARYLDFLQVAVPGHCRALHRQSAV